MPSKHSSEMSYTNEDSEEDEIHYQEFGKNRGGGVNEEDHVLNSDDEYVDEEDWDDDELKEPPIVVQQTSPPIVLQPRPPTPPPPPPPPRVRWTEKAMVKKYNPKKPASYINRRKQKLQDNHHRRRPRIPRAMRRAKPPAKFGLKRRQNNNY